MSTRTAIPHPIPYQGSKRALASRILASLRGQRFGCLYEPFAGSCALTLAAARMHVADSYHISDALEPLVAIWRAIIEQPTILADRYEKIWFEQFQNPHHYVELRTEFNRCAGSAELLYLLVRCVKNAPRFNAHGAFNQSADLRRAGMHPNKMRQAIFGAAALLGNRATADCQDFQCALQLATPDDLIYLDPPYEGTTVGNDKRYYRQVSRKRLIESLNDLNARRIPYLLSYDGQHGSKTYGAPLPETLNLQKILIPAGRSTQATLNGTHVVTLESLYFSPALQARHAPALAL